MYEEENEIDKERCNYHLCRKKTKLYKCKYCGRYFCKNHISPKLALTKSFIDSIRDRILKEKLYEEWRKENGHPDPVWTEKFWNEIREKEERERKILEDFLESSKRVKEIVIPTYYFHENYSDKNERDLLEMSERVREIATPIFYSDERKRKRGSRSEDDTRVIRIKIPSIVLYILLLVILILIFAFLIHSNMNEKSSIASHSLHNCSDGTPHNHCSINKPFYCFNGTLIKNSSLCGCPENYIQKGNDCELILRCEDGTPYGECSKNKPLFCQNGSLINKASLCGCHKDMIRDGDKCISKYEVGPIVRKFKYVLRGESKNISLILYTGLKDYLASLPRFYYCNPICPSDRDLKLRFLDESIQRKYLSSLVNIIKSYTNNQDDQVRIAVSIVQNIPYDYEKAQTTSFYTRYPYEVLYENKGVCEEKSLLLAFILRELGYGVVLFEFEKENHMAVGIKCPIQYSYRNSGYCFIETTRPSIITYSEGEYVGVGRLISTPKIIEISDGKSFDSVSEEYFDAIEWNKLIMLSKLSGGYLDEHHYYKWLFLVLKYGIKISE